MKLQDWQYTFEQAQAIKNNDMNARNAFYFDNFKRLEVMAQTYVNMRNELGQTQYEVSDLLSQVYLDLPYLSYDSPATLTFSLKKKSFRFSVFGGLSYFIETKTSYSDIERRKLNIISTDQTIKNDIGSDTPFIDLYCSAPSVDEDFEKRNKPDYIEELRNILVNYLPVKQVDFLLLDCEGYTQAEACRKIGVKVGSIPKMGIVKKLRAHYSEVVDALVKANCDAVLPYIGIVPSENNFKRPYKLTPEQRARAAESMRRQRAAKKALSNPLPPAA